MATDKDKKGKVSLNIRSRNTKKTNNSKTYNDASKLKELNSAFETPKSNKKTTKASKTKKEKPVKEKKPRKLNSFMLFAKEKRESVKKNNPTAKVTEIAKKLGELWRALSNSEKQKYKQ